MADKSKEYGAEGGKARAERLSKAELSEIGKRGAAERWGSGLPVAEFTGTLRIGEIELPCAVLGDGTRVLTQGEVLEAMGRHRKANVRYAKGEEPVPPILQGERLKPFISQELLAKSQPVRFRMKGGSLASGYRAEILPAVCEVYLKARDAGALQKQQLHIAAQSDILIRGLATVGIIALVDEATGYQAARDQNALAKILEAYVTAELRKWVRTFPRTFFEQLCRLREIPFPENMRLPQYFGHLINDLVYDRLAPAVKDELRRLNPTENGRRKAKHHQFLTENVGHPKLLHHLGVLEGLARGFGPGKYEDFYKAVNRALPNHVSLPLFAASVGAEDEQAPLSLPAQTSQ